MSLRELTPDDRPPIDRTHPSVLVLARAQDSAGLRSCLESLSAHVPTETPIVVLTPTAESVRAVRKAAKRRELWYLAPASAPGGEGAAHPVTQATNRALRLLAPGDVALLLEPVAVAPGWLEDLRAAAHADSNIASASAMTASGGPLSVADADRPGGDLSELAAAVAEQTLRLRPRLGGICGPCVYLRGDALALVGALDERLSPRWAVEVDLAQRCLLRGLSHVAADDVVVERPDGESEDGDLPPELRSRYPHLGATPSIAASGVLTRAIEAARRPRARLWVTIDGRSLGATVTGTHVHMLQLITALHATARLRLRVLVSDETSPDTVQRLRSLPETEVLPVSEITPDTPRSTLFHRPQQVFETNDLWFAFRLGERVVVNQLDLIAYRNPSYFPDADAWLAHQRASRQALAAADRIVVFSEHTRSELLSDELAEDERVRVVAPGVDHVVRGVGERPDGLGHPDSGSAEDAAFLLCLGTDFRHKNRVFALQMLAALGQRHAWRGRLVLAGAHMAHGSSRTEEAAWLHAHPGLESQLVDLGAVSEEHKSWLLGNAAAVLYPTTYEGFGLVPFECALRGAPCAFAPSSSLAEVLPSGTPVIVPWDAQESADRLHDLLTDDAARDRHVQAVAAAAAPLTWQASAAGIVEVYEEAAVAPIRVAAALSRDQVGREIERRALIEAHDALVRRLVAEREHAQHMYDDLHAEVGFALGLIGPHGSLPEDVQRALLALGARPALSRGVYGATAAGFRMGRSLARRIRP